MANTVTKLSERKQDIGKEAAIEAEVRAARERALVPLETRVISFKEMLKEKDVRSVWPNFAQFQKHFTKQIKLSFRRYLHSVHGRRNCIRLYSIRGTFC